MAASGEVKLGDKVKDEVTSIEGIAIGITTWLNGCRRVIIQPQTKKNADKVPDNFSADEPNVKVLTVGAVKGQNSGDTSIDVGRGLRTGGPSVTPRNYPTAQR